MISILAIQLSFVSYPPFRIGYLRLSRIARDVGRLDEASVWVSRALTVEEMDPDAGVSLGDLYAGGQRWDEAKKCYEKVIVKVSGLLSFIGWHHEVYRLYRRHHILFEMCRASTY
jgi:tetratricopeptide (TPR) repeat protein